MRLALATPLYPPEIGGPATYSKALEEGLPGQGIEVELIKFAEVRHLPKLIRHFAYFHKVLKAAHRADLVLALDPVSTGFPALLAAKLAGRKLVVKVVGDYAWEQGSQRYGITSTLDDFVKTKRMPFSVQFLRMIETHVAGSAALVLVPSEYLKKIVMAWGIPAAKIKVIYNAVPLDSSGRASAIATALPRPLVVTVGRLVPWKRIDGIIDACAQANASLAIVGDGPLRTQLTKRASEKLGNRAVLTGQLSHADTLATMKAADVFVLNSSYEGLSHLLIEALGLGIAIIATDVGGNPEVITNEVSGLLVPAGDAAALEAALTRVLGDDGLRARLGVGAKAAAERFSTGVMIPSTAALLKSLI